MKLILFSRILGIALIVPILGQVSKRLNPLLCQGKNVEKKQLQGKRKRYRKRLWVVEHKSASDTYHILTGFMPKHFFCKCREKHGRAEDKQT